ncbi:hypothetical protein DV706_02975 [Natronorubrum bangense]|uniref:Uncharacterized protein n=1 Tax=Natronorubrum bangense TaxID=61858 RepID=A0A4D6HH62_9EURY|nr:hypothetical protein DV706_02975 [Natronorubrum bangense]
MCTRGTAIVATESQCTPNQTTAVRSVCKSFQLLLYWPSNNRRRGAVGVEGTTKPVSPRLQSFNELGCGTHGLRVHPAARRI